MNCQQRADKFRQALGQLCLQHGVAAVCTFAVDGQVTHGAQSAYAPDRTTLYALTDCSIRLGMRVMRNSQALYEEPEEAPPGLQVPRLVPAR